VAAVLALAAILQKDRGRHPLELVLFNGEDYYAVPGQMNYLEQNTGRFGDILLNINFDGAGYKEGLSAFSPMNLPASMLETLDKVICDHPNIVKGSPWYQGDHSIFLQNGVPALAVSSQWFLENMEHQEITHTPNDHLGIVNCERMAECVLGIHSLIRKI